MKASRRRCAILGKGDNLHVKSGELDQYRGYVVADIDALENTLKFTKAWCDRWRCEGRCERDGAAPPPDS